MDALEAVIQSLTSDEVRRFKILSNRFKSGEKKLIVLFDALRSEKYPREDDLVSDLYGKANPETKNSYYRLRNKLLENIGKSLVFYHFKSNKPIHALNDLQLAVLMKERSSLQMAVYFLKKSEKTALSLDQFNILELVFDEFVELAKQIPEIDVPEILRKRKANQVKLRVQQRNAEGIALMRQELISSRVSNAPGAVTELLESIAGNNKVSQELLDSPEGRLQISKSVSAILQNREMHPQLIEYLKGEISDFESNQLFNQKNHHDRLLMRTGLIESLSKCHMHSEALDQISILEPELEMFDRQDYSAFLFSFLNLKLNTLRDMGKSDDFFEVVQHSLGIPQIKSDPISRLRIQIHSASQQFNAEKSILALESIKEITMDPEFNETENSLQFHVGFLSMICRYECGQIDIMRLEFAEFKRKFRKILKDKEFDPFTSLIKILIRLVERSKQEGRISLGPILRKFEEKFPDQARNPEALIEPLVYLRAQRERVPYYEIYLEDRKRERAKNSPELVN